MEESVLVIKAEEFLKLFKYTKKTIRARLILQIYHSKRFICTFKR